MDEAALKEIGSPTIISARLELIPLPAKALRLLLARDLDPVERLLDLTIPPELYADDTLLRLRLQQLTEDAAYQPWSLRALTLRNPRQIVGYINCHTKPGDPYMQRFAPKGVELGFEIFPAFRRQGYAREACLALMEWAYRQHDVSEFVVSIAPDNEPSLRLARSLGFVKVGTRIDEVDGPEIVFRLSHYPPDAA